MPKVRDPHWVLLKWVENVCFGKPWSSHCLLILLTWVSTAIYHQAHIATFGICSEIFFFYVSLLKVEKLRKIEIFVFVEAKNISTDLPCKHLALFIRMRFLHSFESFLSLWAQFQGRQLSHTKRICQSVLAVRSGFELLVVLFTSSVTLGSIWILLSLISSSI